MPEKSVSGMVARLLTISKTGKKYLEKTLNQLSLPEVLKKNILKYTTVDVKNTKKPTRHTSLKVKSKTSKNITSGKVISSVRADKIFGELASKKMPIISKEAKLEGKGSLAGVVWALDAAEKTNLVEGISVHDISALLYRAAKIEIYPINVSRMVHDNGHLIRQVSQEKRTKRYLLTSDGKKISSKVLFIKQV